MTDPIITDKRLSVYARVVGAYMRNAPRMQQKDIAVALHLGPTAVSRAVQRLHELGYVKRVYNGGRHGGYVWNNRERVAE